MMSKSHAASHLLEAIKSLGSWFDRLSTAKTFGVGPSSSFQSPTLHFITPGGKFKHPRLDCSTMTRFGSFWDAATPASRCLARILKTNVKRRSILLDKDHHYRISNSDRRGFEFEPTIHTSKNKPLKDKRPHPARIGHSPQSRLAVQFIFRRGPHHC